MANDMAVGFGASQGNFQLNVYLPVIAYNFLQSVGLLGDAIRSFNNHCAAGIRPNREQMKKNLQTSLMLVTAVSPEIGYENAAKVAQLAYRENLTLRDACIRLGFLSGEKFDRLCLPEAMV